MRMLGDGAQRVGVNIKPGAVSQMKHANKIDRIALEYIGARHFQAARPNGKTVDLFLPPKQGGQTRCGARFFLCRLQ